MALQGEAMSENKRLINGFEEISHERIKETVKGCECSVRVLTGSASSMLWRLWSDVFTDESKGYNEFYFNQKAPKSLCYCLSAHETEKSGSEPAAMLIRTPYSIAMRTGRDSSKMNADYIVGVATAASERHKGYMDTLLKTSLNDMYDEKIPFAFLIPADPAIYAPYGFSYFYFQKRWDIYRSFLDSDISYYEEMLETPTEEWMDIEKKLVKHSYDMYIRRSRKYYANLFNECRADNGGIVMIRKKDDGSPVGCYSYYSDLNGNKTVIGMSLDKNIAAAAEETAKMRGECRTGIPFMMGRVADAKTMLEHLRTRKKYDHKTVIRFRLSDDIINGNNGYYECRVSDSGCKVIKSDRPGDMGGAEGHSKKDKKVKRLYPELDVTELTGLFISSMGSFCDEQIKNRDRLYMFDRCFINELS